MRKQRFISKLFISYISLAIGAILLIIAFSSEAINDFYLEQRVEDLRIRSELTEVILQSTDMKDHHSVQQICEDIGASTETRITIIRFDGKVIADSDEDPVEMDLHHDRPEIKSAIEDGEGVSQRHSFTLDQDYLYYAKQIQVEGEGLVLRTSFSTINLDQALTSIQNEIKSIGAILIVLTILVNWYISRLITRPIEVMEAGAKRFAKGKLKAQLAEPNIVELASLSSSLNEMAEQIYTRIRVITEQKNEQMTILSSMSEGVIALSPEGDILSINKMASKMFGIKPKKCTGRKLHEVIRHSDLNEFIDLLFSGTETKRSRLSLSYPEERILNIVGNRMPAKKNESAGAVIVLTDLTQILKLEGIRQDFVANVSHELKTPVTSIQGYVETLQDGALKDPQSAEKFLGIIAKHSERLGLIIDELLQLSRLEELIDEADPEVENCSVSDLFGSVIQDLDPIITQGGIKIDQEIEADLTIQANSKMILNAITNLIENALKYSDNGSLIRLKAFSKGKKVILEVEDQGIGIQPEHLDRIFERFYRVDRGRSREVGGTGLGLSLAKHIARIHHATLEVDSVYGEGSTFRIIFRKS